MGRNQTSFIDKTNELRINETNVNGNKSKLCEQMKEMFKETNETNDYGEQTECTCMGRNKTKLYG